MAGVERCLSRPHLRDLHIAAPHERNMRDFLSLIDDADARAAGRVDFALLLPGDKADLLLADDEHTPALWGVVTAGPPENGPHRLTIRAEDAAGEVGTETNTYLTSRGGEYRAPRRAVGGSDADAIGAWPDEHLLGTQLGPNRNGRAW